MRVLVIPVFCTTLLAGSGWAQTPADSAGSTPMISATLGAAPVSRWVVDSTPTQKNRRQTYVALLPASDTVVGDFKTTRPILRLYCHNNVRQVGLEVLVGQQIHGSLPYIASGSHIGWTELKIQRDSEPEQKAKWLYDLDKQVMGPDVREQHKTIEKLVAATHYRVGVMLYKIGRRYMTFDVTDAAERLAWVTDHCGVKEKS
jgi:hypothetical protein